MKTDLYTKSILTVIAFCLFMNFFYNIIRDKVKGIDSNYADSVRIYSKRVLEKETELHEAEKQILSFKTEMEEVLKRESKLKSQMANTKRIAYYAPKYVPCDTSEAVAKESYNELKEGAEIVEKQRDSASVMLDETNKLIANTEEVEKAEDIAQNGLLDEKDKLIALDKKEAKKAKRKAFWNGVKTSLVVAGFIIVAIVVL